MYKYLLTSLLSLFLIFQNITTANATNKLLEKNLIHKYPDGTFEEFSILDIISGILSITIDLQNKENFFIDKNTSKKERNKKIKKFTDNIDSPKEHNETLKIKRSLGKKENHPSAKYVANELIEWYDLLSEIDIDSLTNEQATHLIQYLNPENTTTDQSLLNFIKSAEESTGSKNTGKKLYKKHIEYLNKTNKPLLLFRTEAREKTYDSLKHEKTLKDNEERSLKRKHEHSDTDDEEHPNKK